MEAGQVLHAQDASGVRPHPPHGVERYAEEGRGERQRHLAVQQQRAGAGDQQRLWLAPQAQRGPDVFLLGRTVGDQLATRQQVQPGGELLQPFARERTAGEQARALAAEDAFVGLVGETGVHRQRGVGQIGCRFRTVAAHLAIGPPCGQHVVQHGEVRPPWRQHHGGFADAGVQKGHAQVAGECVEIDHGEP